MVGKMVKEQNYTVTITVGKQTCQNSRVIFLIR